VPSIIDIVKRPFGVMGGWVLGLLWDTKDEKRSSYKKPKLCSSMKQQQQKKVEMVKGTNSCI
jgi:hypothetical protein